MTTTSAVRKANVIVSVYKIMIYDALYVALAEQVGYPLITVDEVIVKKVKGPQHSDPVGRIGIQDGNIELIEHTLIVELAVGKLGTRYHKEKVERSGKVECAVSQRSRPDTWCNNGGKSHYEAVKAGNNKKCRKMSLRDLTMLFALNENEEIRRLTREALETFPDNLPFAYQEEKIDETHVKELRSTAEIWAESGKPRKLQE